MTGFYCWCCPECGKRFEKTTPQGRGIARANHIRGHEGMFGFCLEHGRFKGSRRDKCPECAAIAEREGQKLDKMTRS